MNTPTKIYLDDPNLGTQEKAYLARCVEANYVSTYGPYVPEFEERFSRFLNTERSVATQSGTAALHMALHELGIGPGDEVIVPVLTFIATANSVKYVSARPVFVDVDPDTWNMDPALVERAVTKRTKAIIPVHLYGNPCDMRSIMDIAERRHICVIEDATESLGSKFHGRFTGTFGDFGVFSFNGNKLITTGGGGMITGADPDRLGHIKYLINQARDSSSGYTHSELGFNYRMTNLEAALGLGQMERIGEFIQRKKELSGIYERKLGWRAEIRLQKPQGRSEVVWWLTSGRINPEIGIPVQQMCSELKKKNIPTRGVFAPLVTFPPYKETAAKEFPNAFEIYHNGITFPGSTLNGVDEIEFVTDEIISVLDSTLGRKGRDQKLDSLTQNGLEQVL